MHPGYSNSDSEMCLSYGLFVDVMMAIGAVDHDGCFPSCLTVYGLMHGWNTTSRVESSLAALGLTS